MRTHNPTKLSFSTPASRSMSLKVVVVIVVVDDGGGGGVVTNYK